MAACLSGTGDSRELIVFLLDPSYNRKTCFEQAQGAFKCPLNVRVPPQSALELIHNTRTWFFETGFWSTRTRLCEIDRYLDDMFMVREFRVLCSYLCHRSRSGALEALSLLSMPSHHAAEARLAGCRSRVAVGLVEDLDEVTTGD